MERAVTFEQTADEFLEALRRGGTATRTERAAQRGMGRRVMGLGVACGISAALLLWYIGAETRQWVAGLSLGPLFVVMGWWLWRTEGGGSSSQERLEVRLGEHGRFPRRCVYAIGAEGLLFDHGHSRGVLRWGAIRDIERRNGYLRIEYFRRGGFLIPVSAFASEGEAVAFEETVREQMGGSAGADGALVTHGWDACATEGGGRGAVKTVVFEQTLKGMIQSFRKGATASAARRKHSHAAGREGIVIGVVFGGFMSVVPALYAKSKWDWLLPIMVSAFFAGMGMVMSRTALSSVRSTLQLLAKQGRFGPLPQRFAYAITDEGFAYDHGHSAGVVRWGAIEGVAREGGYMRVEYFRPEGFLVPLAAFTSEVEADGFEGEIRARIAERGLAA